MKKLDYRFVLVEKCKKSIIPIRKWLNSCRGFFNPKHIHMIPDSNHSLFFFYPRSAQK